MHTNMWPCMAATQGDPEANDPLNSYQNDDLYFWNQNCYIRITQCSHKFSTPLRLFNFFYLISFFKFTFNLCIGIFADFFHFLKKISMIRGMKREELTIWGHSYDNSGINKTEHAVHSYTAGQGYL